jgi:hypothetical protein
VKFDRQHQTAAAYFTDRVGADAAQAVEEAHALEGRVFDHPLIDKHAQSCPRDRAGKRVAAEE